MEVGHIIEAQVIRAFDYGLWLKANQEESEILVRIVDLPANPPLYSAKSFAHIGDLHKVKLCDFNSENKYYYGQIFGEEYS